MDEVLLLLLKLGAHRKPVRLTTTELGRGTKMSQQNASRRLKTLEGLGYLERSAKGIQLTKKAYEELASEYALLRQIFESKLEIKGTVVGGIGEGRYYMSRDKYTKQIKDKLHFDPYPGTLNIRLKTDEKWKKDQLLSAEPIVISGFRGDERTYGDIYAYPCSIKGHKCAIIMPLRTSHGPDTLEIICGFEMRKKLRKKDGDELTVIL